MQRIEYSIQNLSQLGFTFNNDASRAIFPEISPIVLLALLTSAAPETRIEAKIWDLATPKPGNEERATIFDCLLDLYVISPVDLSGSGFEMLFFRWEILTRLLYFKGYSKQTLYEKPKIQPISVYEHYQLDKVKLPDPNDAQSIRNIQANKETLESLLVFDSTVKEIRVVFSQTDLTTSSSPCVFLASKSERHTIGYDVGSHVKRVGTKSWLLSPGEVRFSTSSSLKKLDGRSMLKKFDKAKGELGDFPLIMFALLRDRSHSLVPVGKATPKNSTEKARDLEEATGRAWYNEPLYQNKFLFLDSKHVDLLFKNFQKNLRDGEESSSIEQKNGH